MSEAFLEYLEAQHASSNVIQQATRFFMAEKYPTLPPSRMQAEMMLAGASKSDLDSAQTQLEAHPLELENACLLVLSDAWKHPEDQQLIRNAFAEANTKLPVIELAIVAMVAMYAMYLTTTGGVSKKSTQRKADGSFTETTEYYSAVGPLGALVNLFKAGKGQ